MSVFPIHAIFRPGDDRLSPNEKTKVQVNRLLTLFGAVLLLVFGVIRGATGAGSTDPMWMRVGLGLLNASLFGSSYISAFVRKTYARWLEILMYVSLAWFALLTHLNAFSGAYVVGLMFVFMAFSVVIGFGAQKVTSVVSFAAFTTLVVGVAFYTSSSPQISPVLLGATFGSIAIVEGVIIQAWSSLQAKVKQQKEFLQSITDNATDAIFRVKPGDGMVFANHAFVEMFGYESAEEVYSISPARIYKHPEERPRMQSLIEEQGELNEEEIEFRRKDGSTFLGWVNASIVFDDEGAVEYYDGVVRDISERKAYEQALRDERDRFEALFESLPTPVVCCRPRPEGTIIKAVNPAFEEVFGVGRDEASGENIDDMIVPDSEQDDADQIEREALMRGHVSEEVQRETSDGVKAFQLEVSGRSRTEGRHEFYAIYTDVSEQKRREEQLEHEVLHDSLTGIPNRMALRQELEARIGESNEERLSALLYLDLDGFKQVNDRFGHGMGDELLVRIGERLQTVVRTSDLVARIGGDEFAVCLSDAGNVSMVYQIAERVHDTIAQSVSIAGEEIRIGASLGIVVGLSRYGAVDDALRDADSAMYECKETLDTSYVVSEHELQQKGDGPAVRGAGRNGAV